MPDSSFAAGVPAIPAELADRPETGSGAAPCPMERPVERRQVLPGQPLAPFRRPLRGVRLGDAAQGRGDR